MCLVPSEAIRFSEAGFEAIVIYLTWVQGSSGRAA